MRLKKLLKRGVPSFVKDKINSYRESEHLKKFDQLERLSCETDNLRYKDSLSLKEVLNDEEIHSDWLNTEEEIKFFNIPDGTDGVNPGDRRAIYYLIHKLKPSSVLEIGTHIGASTIHIASALNSSQFKKDRKVNFETLDIRDVNSQEDKPWLEFGTKYSPLEMISKSGYDSFVTFTTDKSFNFFADTQKKFDFIFLDGDHSAITVYTEITAALKLLKPNGLILLHDYFPEKKPLWSNGFVLEGPYAATERLIKEGADITILPLGDLPWETKMDSNITSLALLMKKN